MAAQKEAGAPSIDLPPTSYQMEDENRKKNPTEHEDLQMLLRTTPVSFHQFYDALVK
jgi:hypothetical protein